MKVKLSKPKVVTWWIAVIVGVLGLLGHFADLPLASENDFWFVAIGFVLLALATYFKDL